MPKGTLETQGTLVQRDLSHALRGVAEARVRREAAERDFATCAARRETSERALAAQAEVERARLAGGGARVADLVHAERFESALHGQITDEREREARALGRLQEARTAERSAEEALARVKLDERAVEGRRARAAMAERVAREDAHDEAVEEAAAGRRGVA